MVKNKFISTLDFSIAQPTAHSVGQKFILFANNEMPDSSLTQIAYGNLKAGEIVAMHLHESMEEVFFILKGDGVFFIGDEQFAVAKNSCIRIPNKILHSIKADSDMNFYYFGIAK